MEGREVGRADGRVSCYKGAGGGGGEGVDSPPASNCPQHPFLFQHTAQPRPRGSDPSGSIQGG